MDMVNLKENNIHRIFVVSLILKGFDSVLEIIGGVLFLFTGSVTAIITFLIRGELIEDPTDFVAKRLTSFSQSESTESLIVTKRQGMMT